MVSAIVLAAGTSTRMGIANKLLLPYKDRTIIEITIENILNSGIPELIVVLGYNGPEMEARVRHLPLKIVYNHDYEKGLTTSIQKGVQVACGEGLMLCLSDMVFISANEYEMLSSAFEIQWQQDQQAICQPFHKNHGGNPVVFSSYYKNAILNHKDSNGCKTIIRENQAHLYKVEMKTDNVLRDIDSPDDYAGLKNK